MSADSRSVSDDIWLDRRGFPTRANDVTARNPSVMSRKNLEMDDNRILMHYSRVERKYVFSFVVELIFSIAITYRA